MAWWMWVLLGIGLAAAEVLTPGGFFVLFFGVSAIVVGLLVAVDLAGPAWVQWLLFSVIAVVSLLVLRKRLIEMFAGPRARSADLRDLIGEIAVLQSELVPGGVAKAELRGTTWNVRSIDAHTLASGRRCRVERVEGLTLWVAPE
jgi:membrane protein implicated in regulation of membrane protease activity